MHPSRSAAFALAVMSLLAACPVTVNIPVATGASASPPGASPGASPAAPGASPAAPGGATPVPQKPFRFANSTHPKGVLGTVRLELGKRTFKATHTGKENFIVYVTSVVPASPPQVAFSYIGPGSWTWEYFVESAGDYIVDLKDADQEWTLTIE